MVSKTYVLPAPNSTRLPALASESAWSLIHFAPWDVVTLEQRGSMRATTSMHNAQRSPLETLEQDVTTRRLSFLGVQISIPPRYKIHRNS